MPLGVTFRFGLTTSRQSYIVYGGGGVLADPWRCIPLGGEDGGELHITDLDEAVPFAVFPDAPGVNPTGFSPFGDVVDFAANTYYFDFLFPGAIASATLTPGASAVRALTIAWITSPQLGAVSYAIIAIPQPHGADRWVYAVRQELSMVRKNPFFP